MEDTERETGAESGSVYFCMFGVLARECARAYTRAPACQGVNVKEIVHKMWPCVKVYTRMRV